MWVILCVQSIIKCVCVCVLLRDHLVRTGCPDTLASVVRRWVCVSRLMFWSCCSLGRVPAARLWQTPPAGWRSTMTSCSCPVSSLTPGGPCLWESPCFSGASAPWTTSSSTHPLSYSLSHTLSCSHSLSHQDLLVNEVRRCINTGLPVPAGFQEPVCHFKERLFSSESSARVTCSVLTALHTSHGLSLNDAAVSGY